MLGNIIRRIARNGKNQALYARAKDIGTIQLFRNNEEFTAIQLIFLDWLEIYSSLYTDLAMNEKNIDLDVISDDIRAEAYLLWKREQRLKKNKKTNTPKKVKDSGGDIPAVIFTTKKEVKDNGRR